MNSEEYSLLSFIDNDFSLDVRVDDYGMVWLSQKEIAKLYEMSVDNVALKIKDIFKRGELDNSVAKESSVTASDKKKYKTKLYNLEMIVLIGYKVNSKRATIFRRWYEEKIKWDKYDNNLVKNELQIVKIKLSN